MLRKVELDNSFSLQPLILEEACWYLDESSLHEESEYVIILIQWSTDISVFGTGRVNSDKYDCVNSLLSVGIWDIIYHTRLDCGGDVACI